MKIYLFKPAQRWRYCGGGLAIIASCFEECSKFFNEKLCRTEEEADAAENNWDNWVLIEEIPVDEDETPRLVFDDYNWG